MVVDTTIVLHKLFLCHLVLDACSLACLPNKLFQDTRSAWIMQVGLEHDQREGQDLVQGFP